MDKWVNALIHLAGEELCSCGKISRCLEELANTSGFGRERVCTGEHRLEQIFEIGKVQDI